MELIVGKTYEYNNIDNACELPATILCIGKTHIFYRYENYNGTESIIGIEKFIEKYFKE
jgi:hypothetical protein